MKTLAELTAELVSIGVSTELAQVAAAKQYAALVEMSEEAERERKKAEEAAERERKKAEEAAKRAADEAAGVDLWCGVRCSGISFMGKDEKGNAVKVISPGLTGAKALEDGIGLEPAKPGAKPKEGLPVFYPPKLWLMQKGSKPQCLSQYEIAGLVKAIDQHGTDKVVEILRQVGSVEAVAAFEAAKKAGIDAGLYQDSNNKRNRRK